MIIVNDVLATTATFIHGGESIKLYKPIEVSTKKELVFPLQILHEDNHLAVIHKPAGILVSGNSFKTIANALSQNIKASNLPDATRPQPVHRLDFATTGVLLIGKTGSGIRALNKMFENKAIEKVYYAVTIGKMKAYGEITLEIDGKQSKTRYEVLDSVNSPRFGNLNLVKLYPLTGRRHQLRIHLSKIGNPILGDKVYGIDKLILHGKGLYLHAYSLKFIHPFTHEHVLIKDALPKKYQKIFTSLVTKDLQI